MTMHGQNHIKFVLYFDCNYNVHPDFSYDELGTNFYIICRKVWYICHSDIFTQN